MSAKLEYTVDELNNGKTVERILRNKYNVSSSVLTYLKHNSKLFLNEKICRTIDICRTGDMIVADVSENVNQPENISLWKFMPEVLYNDDFLTVVNKPGGMEVHPCPSNRTTTLANAIMYYWATCGEYHNYHIVNRLDKDTSGICVVAKNKYAHGVLSSQMKENVFKRGYFAVIHGVVNPPSGIIDIPIKRDPDSIIKRIAAPDGKYAKTNYKTVNISKNGFSCINVELETGRTHQIRVHFSHIGHPLVGDWLYGKGDMERNLITRHALHANTVEFCHPATKERLCFESKVPHDIQKLINTC